MKLIASLAIVVALAAAGCGGGSDVSTSPHQKSWAEAHPTKNAEAKGELKVICADPERAKLHGCQLFREAMEREGR